MTYKYVSPCDRGFTKLKVSRKLHNEMIPTRKKKPWISANYYHQHGTVEIEYLVTWWGKIVITLALFVPSLFWQGVPNTFKDIASLVFERSRGHFTTDTIYLWKEERDTFAKLRTIIAREARKK